MYERPDGTWQLSTKFPEDEWLSLKSAAEENMRSVNSECLLRLKDTLETDASPIGADDHPWEGASKTLSVRFTDREIVSKLEDIVEDESHSADQEAKHRIIKHPI